MIRFNRNGQGVSVNIDPAMPIFGAIRDALGLTGIKFGCGTYPRRNPQGNRLLISHVRDSRHERSCKADACHSPMTGSL